MMDISIVVSEWEENFRFSQPIPTIPDKKVGTRSKLSLPPTFNVDNPVIFFLFCSKKRDIFQH